MASILYGKTTLAIVETCGLFMLIGILICSCCLCGCDRFKRRRGTVVVPPDPNVVVIQQSTERNANYGQTGFRFWKSRGRQEQA